jgi:hypothetical protein
MYNDLIVKYQKHKNSWLLGPNSVELFVMGLTSFDTGTLKYICKSTWNAR